ncbi:hypothetical protein ACFSW8_09140 [Rubritalea tangerina]|uniref:Iron donor protein CyaY n=2 Tax=Rubritalea tangerina TaxID=430798 RepID=A0ABW4ZBZ5_9BACT
MEQIAQQTQVLAKETLRKAKQEERPYSIILTNREIWVQPENSNLELDLQDASRRTQTIAIPDGVSVSILEQPDDGWFTLKKNSAPFIWTFTQSGLCDNLEIQFEDDNAIETMAFHPLTAGEILDEE